MTNNISDLDYVCINLPKLSACDKKSILEKYLEILEINKTFAEKTGIGTYLFTDKIPKTTLFYIRKDIENKFANY